jgi:hypothetical protein
MKTNPTTTVRMTPRSSKVLSYLEKRHPETSKAKLVEMSLVQVVNSQAELTDAELDECARVSEMLTFQAEKLGSRSDDPSAVKKANHMKVVIAFLARVLARATRLRQIKRL